MRSHAAVATHGRVARWLAAGAALCAALAAPLGAQQATGTIRGRVTEVGSQRPVADAQVTIARTTSGAVTNANGNYVLTSAPSGAREVAARRIGFARRTQAVTVPAGGTVEQNFELAPAASQLDAVVVTGTAGAQEKRQIGNA